MKEVWTWLRAKTAFGGTIPSSEQSYLGHVGLIDAVMPLNGGKLSADGAWLQYDSQIVPDWPQKLPLLAQGAEQIYMPAVWSTPDAVMTILDDPDLQWVAAGNLTTLATVGRFDSPWAGVYLDIESIPGIYRARMSSFLRKIAYCIHDAGLTLGVSVKGRLSEGGAYDLSVVAQVADFVDVRCYGYYSGEDSLHSFGPYWWVRECAEIALSAGIPAERLMIGIGSFARFWQNAEDNGHRDIPVEEALDLIQENDSFIQWIEHNNTGLIRERFADLENGHIWLHDGDTLRHSLNLIDFYGLRGLAFWVPGMESANTWDTIAQWKD